MDFSNGVFFLLMSTVGLGIYQLDESPKEVINVKQLSEENSIITSEDEV